MRLLREAGIPCETISLNRNAPDEIAKPYSSWREIYEELRPNIIIASLGGIHYAVRIREELKRDGVRIPVGQWLHGQGDYAFSAARKDFFIFNSRRQWFAGRWRCGFREGNNPMENIGTPQYIFHPPVIPEDVIADNRHPSAITMVNYSVFKGGDIFRRIIQEAIRHPRIPRTFLAVRGGWDYGQTIDLAGLMRRGRYAVSIETLPRQKDMRVVYAMTKILIHASQYESFGMVILEAMMNGIPVIGKSTDGFAEICLDDLDQPAGYRVDTPGSPRAWLRAVEEVEADYEEWSSRAKARAQKFDPRKAIPGLIEFLSGVALS